jgi:cytochrome P450
MNAPLKIQPPPAPTPDAPERLAGKTAAERAATHTEPVRPAPVAKGLPILGQLPALRKKGFMGVMFDEWHRHGDAFRIKLGPRPAFVIAHPDGIERVLAGHLDNYPKGSAYDGVREILGEGLVTAMGRHWRKQRTLIQPTFHRASLGEMVTCMVEQADAYFADLKQRHPSGGVIDVHREMTKLTMDVVINALFGAGLLSSAEVSYESMVSALAMVNERGNGYALPLAIPTPANLRFKRVIKELDGVVYGLIHKARAMGPDHPSIRSTLLGMFLTSQDAETGEPIPDALIRDELLTFFLAGHETTALTMTWLFTLLDQAPDVVEKLREESERVVGDRLPTFEDLPKLTYTLQVIYETLRLRGPVAVIARNAIADDNICGFQVKKGDMVMPFFYGVHRHPDYWEDPERFDPDRFTEARSKGRDRWCYIPFSAGQRVCIGNNFSLYESQLIIAMLVRLCDFKLVPGQHIEPQMVATVRPSAPVMVDVGWR